MERERERERERLASNANGTDFTKWLWSFLSDPIPNNKELTVHFSHWCELTDIRLLTALWVFWRAGLLTNWFVFFSSANSEKTQCAICSVHCVLCAMCFYSLLLHMSRPTFPVHVFVCVCLSVSVWEWGCECVSGCVRKWIASVMQMLLFTDTHSIHSWKCNCSIHPIFYACICESFSLSSSSSSLSSSSPSSSSSSSHLFLFPFLFASASAFLSRGQRTLTQAKRWVRFSLFSPFTFTLELGFASASDFAAFIFTHPRGGHHNLILVPFSHFPKATCVPRFF